ncbi:MAG: hypothetical protein KBC30_08875 [Planctomycetes bacterium]|nr:hypothetical protein [Planctomycetota bacterium]
MGWFDELKKRERLSIVKELACYLGNLAHIQGGILRDLIENYEFILDDFILENLEYILEYLSVDGYTLIEKLVPYKDNVYQQISVFAEEDPEINKFLQISAKRIKERCQAIILFIQEDIEEALKESQEACHQAEENQQQEISSNIQQETMPRKHITQEQSTSENKLQETDKKLNSSSEIKNIILQEQEDTFTPEQVTTSDATKKEIQQAEQEEEEELTPEQIKHLLSVGESWKKEEPKPLSPKEAAEFLGIKNEKQPIQQNKIIAQQGKAIRPDLWKKNISEQNKINLENIEKSEESQETMHKEKKLDEPQEMSPKEATQFFQAQKRADRPKEITTKEAMHKEKKLDEPQEMSPKEATQFFQAQKRADRPKEITTKEAMHKEKKLDEPQEMSPKEATQFFQAQKRADRPKEITTKEATQQEKKSDEPQEMSPKEATQFFQAQKRATVKGQSTEKQSTDLLVQKKTVYNRKTDPYA